MPRPSARTKYFLSRTIFKLSRTKILSRVKKSIFCFEKSFKIKFLVERTLKIYFQLEIFIMHGFWKQKIDFLTLEKKYFVWADGRGVNCPLGSYWFQLYHVLNQLTIGFWRVGKQTISEDPKTFFYELILIWQLSPIQYDDNRWSCYLLLNF